MTWGEEWWGQTGSVRWFVSSPCRSASTYTHTHPAAQTSCSHHCRVKFFFPAWFMLCICASPSWEAPTLMSSGPPRLCPGLRYFFLQGQPDLGGGLCNSIGLQICLRSILILFKGQSIEPSLGFSETEFHIAFNMCWMHRPGEKAFQCRWDIKDGMGNVLQPFSFSILGSEALMSWAEEGPRKSWLPMGFAGSSPDSH